MAELTAVTIVAEAGDLMRFAKPSQLFSYGGLVPSEYSSGETTRRGSITKTGNAHLRRVLVESAWAYRRPVVLTHSRSGSGPGWASSRPAPGPVNDRSLVSLMGSTAPSSGLATHRATPCCEPSWSRASFTETVDQREAHSMGGGPAAMEA